jgi:ATP-dependent Lhr-like helicase
MLDAVLNQMAVRNYNEIPAMSLGFFHPATARWFSDTLGKPTDAQERGWRAICERRHTLIAAPTGSGKTLAAFLVTLDNLLKSGLTAPLADEVRVLYVSPLKALSADIHKNLGEPRRGIRRIAEELGFQAPRITAAVRTGDTPQSERAAMLRMPPHILITTPESLYLLLTAERSREMLRTVRTVIVDEIHAVIGTKRGAHLALSLERLQQVTESPLVRIGLSATQKPIEEVARYLVGTNAVDANGGADCTIVDEGHRRAIDLALELPRSPVEAVMSHEVWEEYYDRLTELIRAHRTTLVFVNTRRLAERVTRHLSDRLGNELVTAHHGSLSKEKRLDAEARLKTGQLRALVATASLELGIDIGSVELACQIGSPHRISTLLQRVGRSGHSISGLPKGRLFPMSRDDLVECTALVRSVRAGELDRVFSQDRPLDVLTQQLVAEASCSDYTEESLFALSRRAWPYRDLSRADFDAVVRMAAEGFGTRRGRRAALLHRDEVHARVRGRRGSRLLALSSGGAIPEVADYRVVLDPEDIFVGTLNEDFAIESMVGDVFQLGNASWRVLQVGTGVVRVADAKGAPPNIPFWLGEAPARSDELSRGVSELRREIEARLADPASSDCSDAAAVEWLVATAGIQPAAAEQIVAYLSDARQALGVVPTQDAIVLERFFDESGGMQLVLHAPFGRRVNAAWGLALRKRFCRQFNFELQAAATDEALLLSLGPQHSFPLADVFRYLHPASVRDILIQALLDAPVFQTRWRWNTTVSLAVPRNRRGRKVPPQLQRMMADDLMAAAFPDAAACLENIPGDREIPDHPLVNQTVRDCLHEAMDFDGLTAVLERIHRGTIACISRDTPEPSALAHEILTARPYAFLDDAPLEERRAQAVQTRRAGQPSSAADLGALDPAAIAHVRFEQRPDPRDADELHDALLTAGFLEAGSGEAGLVNSESAGLMDQLIAASRATRAMLGDRSVWVAAERLPEFLALHPRLTLDPAVAAPAHRALREWTRESAATEIVRGRLTLEGPITTTALATSLAIGTSEAEAALLALESEGAVLRGSFSPDCQDLEWCDRALLARIHRYTLNRLRAEIEPVSPADLMRFLFVWQHVHPAARLSGIDGLRTVIGVLEGFDAPIRAWERTLLPTRLDRYDPGMLDTLCLTGEVGWRQDAPAAVSLFLREHGLGGLKTASAPEASTVRGRGSESEEILEMLRADGASFFRDLVAHSSQHDKLGVGRALAELAATGIVRSDGFGGVRALARVARGDPDRLEHHMRSAGRWSLVACDAVTDEAAVEAQAWTLLRRYGVICRRLLGRETNVAPWRELTRVYRRLEARGEIRGGRFVSGMSGEQFASVDAVARLREIRRTGPDDAVIVVSGVDPLNLAGIVTSGERVRAVASTRIAYRNGVPTAAMEGDYVRPLVDTGNEIAAEVITGLAGRRMPALAGGYVGRPPQ